MSANRTVLESPPEKPECLDGDAWDPPGCEKVVLGAMHHGVKRKNRATPSPQYDRLCDDGEETKRDAGDMGFTCHA